MFAGGENCSWNVACAVGTRGDKDCLWCLYHLLALTKHYSINYTLLLISHWAGWSGDCCVFSQQPAVLLNTKLCWPLSQSPVISAGSQSTALWSSHQTKSSVWNFTTGQATEWDDLVRGTWVRHLACYWWMSLSPSRLWLSTVTGSVGGDVWTQVAHSVWETLGTPLWPQTQMKRYVFASVQWVFLIQLSLNKCFVFTFVVVVF